MFKISKPARDLIIIAGILAACLGPFVNKAVHMDDPLFVWTAKQIQSHPGDFYGFDVNWFGSQVPMPLATCNPPLASYYMAAAASVFGWHEVVLHLAFLVVAFAACSGIYHLAKSWCEWPLLATVVAIISPVFLISSTTLMCDALMLALWVWSVVFWESALERGGLARWIFAGSLPGLAVLAKYNAITLLPLLFVLAALRMRKVGWWLLGLAVPLIMLAAFEFLTSRLYGVGLFQMAAEYARARGSVFSQGWRTKMIIGLAFTGGSVLPLLFVSARLWPARVIWVGGALLLGFALGGIWLFGRTEFTHDWSYLLQAVLLVAGGMHLLLVAGVEAWQRRDTVSTVLTLWILSGLVFATVLNWTISARSLMPIVPAVAILTMRRWARFRACPQASVQFLWPLFPATVAALCLATVDFRLASSSKSAAEQIVAKYEAGGHKIWFEGHWGFQYYMEKLGAEAVDFEESIIQSGDILILPSNNSNVTSVPAEDAELLETIEFAPCEWLGMMQRELGVGFYAVEGGPLPFAFGRAAPERYSVFRFVRTWNLNPTRTVLREGMQGLPNLRRPADPNQPGFDAVSRAAFVRVRVHVTLAMWLEQQGRMKKAVQHYRAALDSMPDYPVVLNNLAWILAANPRPELRNGPEAVRLATRAVELTGHQEPIILGTLAAAYAEAGQFAKAIETAEAARKLALEIGLPEVAVRNEKLLELYRAGRAAWQVAP